MKEILVEGQMFDLIYLYQFIKRLVTPFEKTKAFELGIIDKEGKVLRKRAELTTSDEKDAYTLFDTLIFNLKKLLGKIPAGKTRLGSFVAGLLLLKEEKNIRFQVLQENNEDVLELRFNELKSFIIENRDQYSHAINEAYAELENEEMTTADVPTTQEPVVSPKARKKYKKNLSVMRNDGTGPRSVAGTCVKEEDDIEGIGKYGKLKVFDVDTATFIKAKQGKGRFDRYKKFVGGEGLEDHITQYARNNPAMPVILRDKNTGALCFLRYGKVTDEELTKYYHS